MSEKDIKREEAKTHLILQSCTKAGESMWLSTAAAVAKVRPSLQFPDYQRRRKIKMHKTERRTSRLIKIKLYMLSIKIY
jgi:hypothetical protein